MKFSLQSYGKTTTIETTHDDLDIDEVLDIFETLVISATYDKDSWKRAILDLACEYKSFNCGDDCKCKK
jgi:hypothetical protein